MCCCLHAKLIFQTFRLLKVASFLMQRKQLCSSSVFPSSLLNGRLRRRRRRHACPYRVEKANFYGSATGIKLCVCWEKNGMEMLRQKIQLMPLLWNVLEGFFLSFFPNKSTRVSMLFLFSYWEMYWSYLENREREWLMVFAWKYVSCVSYKWSYSPFLTLWLLIIFVMSFALHHHQLLLLECFYLLCDTFWVTNL